MTTIMDIMAFILASMAIFAIFMLYRNEVVFKARKQANELCFNLSNRDTAKSKTIEELMSLIEYNKYYAYFDAQPSYNKMMFQFHKRKMCDFYPMLCEWNKGE